MWTTVIHKILKYFFLLQTQSIEHGRDANNNLAPNVFTALYGLSSDHLADIKRFVRYVQRIDGLEQYSIFGDNHSNQSSSNNGIFFN